MKIKSKSQVTLFLIIGIIMIIITLSFVLLSRYGAKKISRQEAIESKEAVFDVQPVKNFVTECLSKVSVSGLKLIGSQGGYIFKSQGGSLIDYPDSDEGIFFINNGNSKVVYNILNPRFSIGIYSPIAPNYPWKTFPYKDESKTEKIFAAKDAFGTNSMPPLLNSLGAQSMQAQLATYISNHIDSCLDFSIFEERGLNITKKGKNIQADINQDDAVFRMEYQLEVKNLASGEKTQLKDFFVRNNVRLGRLHQFVNRIIEEDISNIKFDITNNSEQDFSVAITRDKYHKDDIISVTDKKSSINGINYNYIFARKNRKPALFYLSPVEISVPTFNPETNQFSIVTNSTLLGSQILSAIDPDEDVIDKGSFSIAPETPITMVFPKVDFKVAVTDGSLEDYQIISVRRG